jgi:hypothetical protein
MVVSSSKPSHIGHILGKLWAVSNTDVTYQTHWHIIQNLKEPCPLLHSAAETLHWKVPLLPIMLHPFPFKISIINTTRIASLSSLTNLKKGITTHLFLPSTVRNYSATNKYLIHKICNQWLQIVLPLLYLEETLFTQRKHPTLTVTLKLHCCEI